MTTTTSTGAIVIRRATDADIFALADLAILDSREPLTGPALIAEVDGVVVAALDLHDGSVAADPFAPTAELVELLRLHARAGRAAHRARLAARPRRVDHATGVRPCIRPRSRRSPRGGPTLPTHRPHATSRPRHAPTGEPLRAPPRARPRPPPPQRPPSGARGPPTARPNVPRARRARGDVGQPSARVGRRHLRHHAEQLVDAGPDKQIGGPAPGAVCSPHARRVVVVGGLAVASASAIAI